MKDEFLYDLLRYIAKHPISMPEVPRVATDEEVVDFINLFMRPARCQNNSSTSYGLKHIAERAIGYIFHGSSTYCYVSNIQFKSCMRKASNRYVARDVDDDGVNEVYNFRWRKGAMEIFEITGVVGAVPQKGLLDD